jgi:hypothetical protein
MIFYGKVKLSIVSNQSYSNLSKLSYSNRLNNKSGKSCILQNYWNIYHQNICGLKSKINELLGSLYPNLPHIICSSEYHLRHAEIVKWCYQLQTGSKKFLLLRSFYSLNEYYEWNMRDDLVSYKWICINDSL